MDSLFFKIFYFCKYKINIKFNFMPILYLMAILGFNSNRYRIRHCPVLSYLVPLVSFVKSWSLENH